MLYKPAEQAVFQVMVIEYMVVPCDLYFAQFLLCWGCSKRFIFSWSQLKTCWTVIRAQSEQSLQKINSWSLTHSFFKNALCSFVMSVSEKFADIFFHKFLNLFSNFLSTITKRYAELTFFHRWVTATDDVFSLYWTERRTNHSLIGEAACEGNPAGAATTRALGWNSLFLLNLIPF